MHAVTNGSRNTYETSVVDELCKPPPPSSRNTSLLLARYSRAVRTNLNPTASRQSRDTRDSRHIRSSRAKFVRARRAAFQTFHVTIPPGGGKRGKAFIEHLGQVSAAPAAPGKTTPSSLVQSPSCRRRFISAAD